MREIFIIKEIFAILAGISFKYLSMPDGLDISKTEIPKAAAQIKYRKTANGIEIKEISGVSATEVLKKIYGLPVVYYGKDLSSRVGIYEESEEI